MPIPVETATLIMLGSMIFLMMLGLPLAFVTISIAAVGAVVFIGPHALPLLASRMYSLITEYTLVAVPLFILMSTFMEKAGIAEDLFEAMSVWGNSIPGSVGVQTMVAAIFLAAITGIAGGELLMLGLVALPQLLRLNYDKHLSVGLICVGGGLGTMIPPSIILIFFALEAGVPTGDLFLASFIPGFMLASFYIIYIIVRCYLDPSKGPPRKKEDIPPLNERIKLLKKLIAPGIIALWIMVSIYGGIATVTETAATGALAALLIGIKRKKVNFKFLKDCLSYTLSVTGRLFWLTMGSTSLIGVFSIMGATAYLKSMVLGLPFEPIGIVLTMMGILVILGMFMDWIGILLLTSPIFVPIIIQLGFSPIWYGVLFSLNMQVSFVSPPFGPACFYIKSVAPPEISILDIFKGVMPFMLLQILAITIVILYPDIALFLPNWMNK